MTASPAHVPDPGIAGRVPTAVVVEDGRVRVRWTALRDLRFVHPFFEDTTARARAFPENRPPTVTDAAALFDAAALLPPPPPPTFLFHVSRCGSTLLTQQLALDDRCIVLSEAPVLDACLRLHLKSPGVVSEETGDRLFLAALAVLARPRFPAESLLFVKADSWHVHLHGRLRRMFPDAPMVLLHREPSAVLESHRRQPGMHAVPGMIEPEVFGFDAEDRAEILPLPHLDRVLRTYYERMAAILRSDPRAHALGYVPDGAALFGRFCALVGHTPPAALRERLAERGRFHAKRPGQAFEEPCAPAAPVPVSARTLAAYGTLLAAARPLVPSRGESA